jgi:hypothetical protein
MADLSASVVGTRTYPLWDGFARAGADVIERQIRSISRVGESVPGTYVLVLANLAVHPIA